MTNHEQSLPPHAVLMGLMGGLWVSQSIAVVAKLGVADAIAKGARTSDEIAAATGSHGPSLFRVLRALSSVGVFVEEAGRFALTPVGETLRSGPGSLRGMAVFLGEPFHARAVGDLLHCVRTGKPAFEHVHGARFFDYVTTHPDAAEVFDEAMNSNTSAQRDAVVEAYDFSGLGTLVDVAGGHGTLLAAVLQATPGLKGVLFDLPHVAAKARKVFEAAGVASRVEVASGDFFKALPAGDAYMMKHIIHDWDDDRCVQILQNCRKAMRGAGRVLVVDGVIPPGNDPFPGKLLDLEMLLMTDGGRERTRAEFETLFARAGLKLSRVVPTRSEVSIVEGVPA
jgi:hypothetical protein